MQRTFPNPQISWRRESIGLTTTTSILVQPPFQGLRKRTSRSRKTSCRRFRQFFHCRGKNQNLAECEKRRPMRRRFSRRTGGQLPEPLTEILVTFTIVARAGIGPVKKEKSHAPFVYRRTDGGGNSRPCLLPVAISADRWHDCRHHVLAKSGTVQAEGWEHGSVCRLRAMDFPSGPCVPKVRKAHEPVKGMFIC